MGGQRSQKGAIERQRAGAKVSATEIRAEKSHEPKRLFRDNTPVFVAWPDAFSIRRRALLLRYNDAEMPVVRIGELDADGAYTGGLEDPRALSPDLIMGPIAKGWGDHPVTVSPGRMTTMPTNAELLNRMVTAPVVPMPEPVALPKEKRASKRPAAAMTAFCPTHPNVQLSLAREQPGPNRTSRVVRECLISGCLYIEELRGPNDWAPVVAIKEKLGICPIDSMPLRVSQAGAVRHCTRIACEYHEVKNVNGEWVKSGTFVEKPVEQHTPWGIAHSAPPAPAIVTSSSGPSSVPDKTPTKREVVLAGASRPVDEVDPRCPAHALLLIPTKSKAQKLCPKDGCDYYVAKQDDGSWREMRDATVATPASGFIPSLDEPPPFDEPAPWEV